MSFKEKINNGLSKIKSDKKIQIYLGIAIVAVIVIVASGIVISNKQHEEEQNAIHTYTIPENEKIFINGLIVPKQSKDIMGPANGVTPDIRVSNGQSVKKDDVLYIVKDEAAIEEIASIKTQLKNLISEKKGLKSDDPAITAINGQIATLNTSLSAANAKAYTKVKAPFDGKVYLNNNQNQTPDSNILMTVQTTDYVMNGQISEQDLSKIKSDMTADITILSTGDTVKGRVSYISDRPIASSAPQASTAGGEAGSSESISFYNIVFSLDTQEGIVDGYHAQSVIEVNTDKHKIPSEAIINDGSEVYVFIESEGYLKKVNVEILSESGQYAVVTGDLNQDDVVVKNPTKKMKDGDPIPQQGDEDKSKDSSKEKSDN
ncbi:efflux RND transporter periplasmic adaptor subunit [Peptostreptococcus russellii]|uniref:efflux RND transporter periplasmic adaptor subunit n=1 Tax=Peptostreptococcus russellii TaxID=215200 RepID=UPI001629DE56|nr:efflux RND transporter periplasmic adaptor subunit [Peptostreptococcus russellii]MBC2577351.1 efflux RND transporter periplasmic adaptor subunit [Peptostreptococcus russellii]